MKAEYKNIINTQRSRLEEVIPLDTPYVVAVDPSNLCNFKCKFCGIQQMQSRVNNKFPFKTMEFELFKKIVDDLADMPKPIKMLRLAGNGEPLINPKFCDFVRYAKKSGRIGWIETITNASLLNEELNSEIAESGLDRIRVSIEAVTQEEYCDITETKVDFEKIVRNLTDLYNKTRNKGCQIYIKIVDVSVREEEKKQKFFDIFGDIADRVFIDTIIPEWSDYDEINDKLKLDGTKGVHGQEVRDVLICPFPYYQCKIHPDGIVTMCCADWERKFVIGDITKESFKDIWNNKNLREFWLENAKGNKNKFDMCRTCLAPNYDSIDDIDPYSELIVSKLV